MAIRFGVHAGLHKTTVGELRDLWTRVDELGFDWCSVWDHFYAAEPGGGHDCLEAVAMHSALAVTTTRVRCGCLVYSAGYRHPAVLANAITTIDHLSGGRAVIGLGAGWLESEYRAYGIDFAAPGVRLRMLDEALACVRALLHSPGPADFSGEFFSLHDAHLEPRPVQARLPVWVGGTGEKVTLRIAARHADGWNAVFVTPDAYRHKREVLAAHCGDAGRSIAEIECSANVALSANDDTLREQFASLTDFIAPGAVVGGRAQMIDRVGEFADAGAQTVICSLRPPFDLTTLERFATEVVPAFA